MGNGENEVLCLQAVLLVRAGIGHSRTAAVAPSGHQAFLPDVRLAEETGVHPGVALEERNADGPQHHGK